MPLCAHECWPGGQWTDPVHALTVAHEATADLTASTEEQAPPSPLDETSRQARLARRRRAVQLQRVSARTRLCQAVAREQKVAAARGLPAREQRPELPPSEWRDLLLRRRLRRPDVLVGAHPAPDQMFWSRRAMSPARGPALVPALDDGVAATTMFSARSPLLRVRAPAEPASRPLDSGVADDDAGAARSSAQHAEMSLRFSCPPLLQAMSKPPCSDPALFASLSRQELGALPHARPPLPPPFSRAVSVFAGMHVETCHPAIHPTPRIRCARTHTHARTRTHADRQCAAEGLQSRLRRLLAARITYSTYAWLPCWLRGTANRRCPCDCVCVWCWWGFACGLAPLVSGTCVLPSPAHHVRICTRTYMRECMRACWHTCAILWMCIEFSTCNHACACTHVHA